MPRYPLDDPFTLASGYGVRKKPHGFGLQGHWGWDMQAYAGAPVYAPENMTITGVWVDDRTPPWVGYGPGGCEGAGDSGVYHLLAHMDPSTLDVREGDVVAEGQRIGTVSTLLHVHWEVRKLAVDGPDTRHDDTVNPADWMAMVAPNSPRPVTPSSSMSPWVWIAILWLVGARHG